MPSPSILLSVGTVLSALSSTALAAPPHRVSSAVVRASPAAVVVSSAAASVAASSDVASVAPAAVSAAAVSAASEPPAAAVSAASEPPAAVSAAAISAASEPPAAASVAAVSVAVSSDVVSASVAAVSDASVASASVASPSVIIVSVTPSVSAYGVPTSAAYGIPTSAAYGIPTSAAYGVPASAAYGAPVSAYGGPASAAYGGPASAAYGGPASAAYGGPASVAYGGPASAAYGAPVSAYGGPASAAYGGYNAQSTPCTTSSRTPGYPPAYPPVYPPSVTSRPVYNDYNNPPVSRTTITRTITSTYVDICETGYITKTSTFAITYCPSTATNTPGKPYYPPSNNYGWDIITKICSNGCGEGPKTVTVTVPCTKCNYVPKTTPTMPKSTPTPGVPNKPYCNGYDCKPDVYITTKVYHTRVITLSTIPVREGPKSISYNGCTGYGCQPEAPVSMPNTPVQGTPIIRPSVPATPIVSKPAVPTAYKPNGPVYGNNGNGTNVVGTGVRATPSKTGYTPPVFTGAASSIQAGSVVAVVGVVAGFFL